MNEEHKKILSELGKNRSYSEETRLKMSISAKGKKLKESTRKLMSEARMGNKNPRYGKPAAHGKGQWYTRKNGDRIWTRSNWEFKTASYLDGMNYEWEYEFFAFPITYEYEGTVKNGTYRPDFKVKIDGIEEIWEVKGYWRDDAKSKFESFIKTYPQYKVLLMDRERLKERRII